MNYKDVINEFKNADERYALSDEYLVSVNSPTRKKEPIAGEFAYGIVYLQDTGVELLIKRIEELEKETNLNLLQEAEAFQNKLSVFREKKEKTACSTIDALLKNENAKNNTKLVLRYVKASQKENLIQQACSLVEKAIELIREAETMDDRILQGVQK